MTSGTPTYSLGATQAFREDRLPHVLPDFTRLSWVNDWARGVWEPRIARIGSAWAEIEWRSVASGIRRCALTSIPSDQLILRSTEWAASGLSMMPVAMSGTSPGYASTSIAPRVGEPFEYRVSVGALADVAELKHAIDAGDDRTMGQLLGFPDCCIAFFRKTWVDEGCVDTTWAMAANGGSVDHSGRLIEIDTASPFQANILWRWMGRAPYLTCPAPSAARPPWLSQTRSWRSAVNVDTAPRWSGLKRF